MEWPPAPSANRSGAGQSAVTDLTFLEPAKLMVGGTPESPGYRQYVFQPGSSRISIPARATLAPVDLTDAPAMSRVAAYSSPSHGDASCAHAAEPLPHSKMTVAI